MILKLKKTKKGHRVATLIASTFVFATLVAIFPVEYTVRAESDRKSEDEVTSTTVITEEVIEETSEITTEEDSTEETTTEGTTTETTTTPTTTTETTTEATTAQIVEEVVEEDEVYGEYQGKFEITVYCPCNECNGRWALWDEDNDCWYTNTFLGPRARVNHTIAVDPDVIPLGSKVMITGDPEVEGIVFTAEDTGNEVYGNHIDLYISDCYDYWWWDNPYLDVYIVG